jgi:branched-chain amino acid transport system substrate-binding protein
VNNLRRPFFAHLAGWVAFGCLAISGQTPQRSQPRVPIGVITIETGESADYGTYTKNGLELALSELGEVPIRLIYKDSKENPQEAVRVFKELQADGVPLVIGPFTSTEARLVGSEAQRVHIVMMTTSATADDLGSIGDYVFMMLPPNQRQGSDQARFAINRLNARRAAILYRLNAYGQSLRKGFAETFKSLGGEILREEAFPDNAEDFRDHLRVLARFKPQVLFIAAHDGDTGRILRQAREVRFPTSKFLGGDGSMTPAMLQLAGEAASASIFSNIASLDPAFNRAYQERFGAEPSGYSATAYDALKIVAGLVKSGATTGARLQQALAAMQGYRGASGVTKFTQRDKSYWCLEKEYRQYEVRSGKYQLLK